jgi:replicative DNA helicase
VQNKRPSISELRDSGTIEQDAYGVLLMYRDEYYHPESEEAGVLEIIVGKNRNGGPGVVKLHFAGDSTKISNLADEYSDWADNSEDRYP